MRKQRLLRTFACCALTMGLAVSMLSCSDDDPDGVARGNGQVVGVVTDDAGTPLGGVEVTLSDVEVTRPVNPRSTTTSDDGRYTFDDVSIDTHMLTFTRKNYQTTTVTLTAAQFGAEGRATVDAEMLYASARIRGTVYDAQQDNAPLAGVTVSISESQSTLTAVDGTWEIGNLPLDDYAVTFSLEGYTPIVKQVGRDAFRDGVATVDVTMGSREILPGRTLEQLREADKWYYSEYRGGGNAESYPHWDWACDYMAALDFVGAWQEQNEGTTLQIRNNGDEQSNPADLDRFDSYVVGSKLITDDNRILTLQVRTHNADEASPAIFGVQVVDLTAPEPVAVKVGGNQSYGSDQYRAFHFDLSEWKGKEVIVAIGIYRAQTGDYYKQLVLRRIAFAQQPIDGWTFIPGTPVNDELAEWNLTMEMVRSTMPHTKRLFSGITRCEGNKDKDNRQTAYQSWRANAHIASEWSFIPRVKDPEVFPSQGYLIKTRGGGTPINTKVPEAYLYAKFAVAAGNNRLTMRIRNFSGSDATFFKLTAIGNDGTVTHLQPSTHTASQAEAAADGCWKFIHENGDEGNPDGYARFEYDLSSFDGHDVLLVLGVYKGEDNGTESKLCIYDVAMN